MRVALSWWPHEIDGSRWRSLGAQAKFEDEHWLAEVNRDGALKLVQRLRSAFKSSCPEPSTGVLGVIRGVGCALEACVKRLELLGDEFLASMTREEDLFGVRGSFGGAGVSLAKQAARNCKDISTLTLGCCRKIETVRAGPRLGAGAVALEEFLAQESELRCRLAAGRAQRWWKLGRRRRLPPQKACCVRSDARVEFLLGCMCAVASW